jgi:septum formation protein
LGVRFLVRPVDLDESPRNGELPRDYVLRLAIEKAAARAEPGELVLAADTIVVIDGEMLGKPLDREDACRMLRRLAGREHTVFTGIALADPSRGEEEADLDESRVQIAPLSAEEIAWYVDTGEPLDKAGAYAIQGLGSLLVERVEGNYTNVVGLPIPRTYRLFKRLGYDLRDFG